MNNPLSVVVLGTGADRRSRSSRPNAMLRICGQPMIRYVLDAVSTIEADQVVVVTNRGNPDVGHELRHVKAIDNIIEQDYPRGSADAVQVALTAVVDDTDDDDVLVVPGDIALIEGDVLRALVRHHRQSNSSTTLLTAIEPEPARQPRVIRSGRGDTVSGVIEDDDLVSTERSITEVFTGIMCVRRSLLVPALRQVSPNNFAGELHLGGVVEVLARAGHPIETFEAPASRALRRIDSRVELASVEHIVRTHINHEWMTRGVQMTDPAHTYIDATVQIGTDVVLLPGTLLEGETVIGDGATIGPHARLTDSVVGARSVVEASTAKGVAIGADCKVGPYVSLSPGAKISAATSLGPFYTSEPNES